MFINRWWLEQPPVIFSYDQMGLRDVLGKYLVEMRNLSSRILEMICEGLGLKRGYFGDVLTGVQMFSVNHYPPCPDPSLALVLKDGKWFVVEPYANAFVVNVGQQLKVITNGKFESSEHRVVTSSKESRYTIASFINRHSDTVIGPEKSLFNKDNGRPLYRIFRYKDFHRAYQAHKASKLSSKRPTSMLRACRKVCSRWSPDMVCLQMNDVVGRVREAFRKGKFPKLWRIKRSIVLAEYGGPNMVDSAMITIVIQLLDAMNKLALLLRKRLGWVGLAV
nr:hyoscyamine 6-dioxygenase-like [Tanacetum cinerariifolium]